MTIEFRSRSAEETFEFGKKLGAVLAYPFVIFLKGEMGAGKT
ncbi:MAG: Threonylcarbamoyl adenosine biosynthesis protein TsaE, partial [Eubacteriaceae bacterium]|nr:Threonylcarbamoyl adenosine biosynthesis protein TsaE [Eubacteriaceae bacterium]